MEQLWKQCAELAAKHRNSDDPSAKHAAKQLRNALDAFPTPATSRETLMAVLLRDLQSMT